MRRPPALRSRGDAAGPSPPPRWRVQAPGDKPCRRCRRRQGDSPSRETWCCFLGGKVPSNFIEFCSFLRAPLPSPPPPTSRSREDGDRVRGGEYGDQGPGCWSGGDQERHEPHLPRNWKGESSNSKPYFVGGRNVALVSHRPPRPAGHLQAPSDSAVGSGRCPPATWPGMVVGGMGDPRQMAGRLQDKRWRCPGR